MVFGIVVAAAIGCQENLAGGAACPTLCPDTLTVHDTVFVGSQGIDTAVTVSNMPPLGSEQSILISNFNQGAERIRSVAVLRFDSLVRVYPDTDTTKPPEYFYATDSAHLAINVTQNADSTKDTLYVQDTTTFSVYDVDLAQSDFDTSGLGAKFGGTPIGVRTVPRDSVKGKLLIPLDSTWFSQHVTAGKRIRLGVQVTSRRDVRVRIGTLEAGGVSSLEYYGKYDTLSTFVQQVANTRPTGTPFLLSLADFQLVLSGTPPADPSLLAVGGMPSSRAFIRFNLPPSLVDSLQTTIIRANLILHQKPNLFFISGDTIQLVTNVVRATSDVLSIPAATLLSVDPSTLSITNMPAQTLFPSEASTDTIPLVSLFVIWKKESPVRTQRAIVLQSSGETIDPRQYFFYGLGAPDSLRPRLEVTYIPNSSFGLP